MPMVTQPVDDLMKCMFHPITEQIINKLLIELDLKHVFDNKVHYRSDASGSSLSSDENGVVEIENNRLTVEIVPNINPFSSKWDVSTFSHGMHGFSSIKNSYSRKPIFHDILSQVTLTEREVPSNLIINVSMKFTDSVAAYATANKIMTVYTNGEKYFLENVAYNYPLPNKLAGMMLGFFKMGNGVVGDFVEYLKMWSDNQISLNINRFDLDTSEKQLVIKKNIGRVLAQIDYSEDKPSANTSGQSTDTLETSFQISLQFARSHMLDLTYPIHVHNQQVPSNLLVVNENNKYIPPEERHPYFNFDLFKKYQETLQPMPENPVMVPWYDDWVIPDNSALPVLKYKPFLSIAFTLDNLEDPEGVTVIDLEDLGVTLIPPIIQKLKEQGGKSLYFSDLINVSVYTNNYPLEPAELTLDGGTILTISNRNPYPTYRLIISEYIGKHHGIINTFRVANVTIVTSLKR